MPPRPLRITPPQSSPAAGGTAIPSPPRRDRIQSAQNVLDRITDIEFDPDEGYNFLFYGESRTGKTTLWSSFPGPILVIICSGGQKPGELRSIDTPEMRAKIKTVTLQVPSELDEISKAVETGHLKHPSGKPYRTIVLDHVSGFQDLKLATMKGLATIPQQKSFGIAKKQDWGEIASQCKEHLVKLLSLKQHVVIIAQERIFLPYSDDDSADKKAIIAEMSMSDVLKPKVGAALIPSLTGWLQPAVDYAAQTYIRPRYIEEEQITKVGKSEVREAIRRRGEGYEYCVRVGVHDIFYTKFRTKAALVGLGGKKMPDTIVLGDTITGVYRNPSGYDKIKVLINGEKP